MITHGLSCAFTTLGTAEKAGLGNKRRQLLPKKLPKSAGDRIRWTTSAGGRPTP
jgi:hypothetical protein